MKTMSFEGSGFEYFKIWIVNILLIVITFGIYYPWAKVRNHRYFYANSTLDGRNFEYHATGKQLFFGYLIAMALLITYAIIQQVSPIGSFIVLGIFLLALPWIIWRSFKFNMRVTSFSNVRFSFEGDLGGAYINFMLLPLLALFSLYAAPILLAVLVPAYAKEPSVLIILFAIVGFIGLLVLALYAFAFTAKKNTTYSINGSRFGQGQFSTLLETRILAKIYLKAAILSIALFIALMVMIAVIATATTGLSGMLELQQVMEGSGEKNSAAIAALTAVILPVYLGFIVIGLIGAAYLQSRFREYVFANSSLDHEISFASNLGARQLAFVMVTNLLLVAITLGLGMPWAKIRMVRLILENTEVDADNIDRYISQNRKNSLL